MPDIILQALGRATIHAMIVKAILASTPTPPADRWYGKVYQATEWSVLAIDRVKEGAALPAPLPTPGHIFIPPGSASVTCLDPAGRDAVVGYVDARRQRNMAWQAWARPCCCGLRRRSGCRSPVKS